MNTMFLQLLLLTLAMLRPATATSRPQSFHLDLAPIDASAGANLTENELLRRAIQRSIDQASRMAYHETTVPKAASTEAAVQPAGGEYVVKLGMGTPAVFFTAVIDTASDLIWAQCQPCTAGCSRQTDPVFNPKLSSSFDVVSCGSSICRRIRTHRCDDQSTCRYTYMYSGNVTTEGTLAIEKLAIGEDVFRDVVFGCSDGSGGGLPPHASGVVGLGRGPLSLVTQLSVRKFMYCLPPLVSRNPGRLVIGSGADPAKNGSDRVSVPLIRDPSYPSYYYLNLNGLAVGDETASLANATTSSGNGSAAYGMIVDIASTITFLEERLYDELVSDLVAEMNLPRGEGSGLGLDLCFILPAGVSMGRVYVPPVSLAFDGVWLKLRKEMLFVEDKDSGMMCLMMGKTQGVSILGNFQQQNMQVIYNLRRRRLTFVKTTC